jgi:gamma-glutamyltranspeptidase/glutathione hydrolase/leukotriene-C4 hydrolase
MLVRTPEGFAELIDFREEAPAAANQTMYVKNPMLGQVGGLAVGIP